MPTNTPRGRLLRPGPFLLSALVLPLAASASPETEALARELAALRAQVSSLEARLEKTQETSTPKKPQPRGEKTETDRKSAIEALRAKLKRKAGIKKTKPPTPEKAIYQNAGLGLQRLNPEISITGDFLSTWSDQPIVNGGKGDFNFRNLGLHFESYLDPYTRFKAAVPVTGGGAALGEAYFTRYGIADGLNLTMGQFRQQFGVVNRWHRHALDQTDFPLALRQIFGDGGLAHSGLSLEWTPRVRGNITHEFTLQLTDADNGRLFGENDAHTPAKLLRYKNYRDLDASTYFEFGLTGLFGENDQWAVGGANRFQDLDTRVYGLDFTFLWEPADRMRYRNRTWRTEFYRLEKDLLTGAGVEDTVEAWGLYSYFQERINRTTDIGLRYDYYKPDQKAWATAASAPLATVGDAEQWALIPYITFNQSPFVHYRLELQHLESRAFARDEDRVTFQVIFAAGPHKHERY